MFANESEAVGWLAGVIDGEGSIWSSATGGREVIIVNTDEELLDGIREAADQLGLFHRTYERSNRSRLGTRRIWEIHLARRDTVEFLAVRVAPAMRSAKAQRLRDLAESYPDRPPTDEAITLYQSGLSIKQVAERLGVPASNVQLWLASAGIERRTTGRRPLPHPPLEELRTAYELGGSVGAVAARFKVSPGTAHRWLRETGLIKPVGHKPERESRSRMR